MSFFKGLGIGLLCVLMFVVGLFFNVWFLDGAEKKGFSFTQSIYSSNKLTPDAFVSNPKFVASEYLSTKTSLNAQEKALIAKTFNEILERVALDKLCRGGSWTVEPTFLYKNGVEIPKGQRLRANLSCKIQAKELEAYNTLLNDIDAIATKSGLMTVSMPALRASFSNELIKENEIKLREELISKALDIAKHYTKLINKHCELKNLDLDSPSRTMSVISEDAVVEGVGTTFKNALPVVGEEERAVNAVATYICR